MGGIVIHNYRWFEAPVIAVPAITIGSDFDGAAADGTSYAKKFSGKYSHQILKAIGVAFILTPSSCVPSKQSAPARRPQSAKGFRLGTRII